MNNREKIPYEEVLMKNKSVDENLIYILKNTTPYQRMIWLKRAFEFWKSRQGLNLSKRKSLKSL